MIAGKITGRKDILLNDVLEAKKEPSQSGFIIEGAKFVADCSPEHIKQVFVTDAEKYSVIVSKFEKVYEVSSSVASKISSAKSGQEVIALAVKNNPPCPEKLVILDRVQDSGNVGTIIRTASAFGFGVIVSADSANPYSVKTARSSAGAILSCYVQKSDLPQITPDLKRRGVYTYSSEIDRSATLLKNISRNKTSFAVIIGNEGCGVSKTISSFADEKIYIPIEKENSLNASIAAAIIMYETNS